MCQKSEVVLRKAVSVCDFQLETYYNVRSIIGREVWADLTDRQLYVTHWTPQLGYLQRRYFEEHRSIMIRLVGKLNSDNL